MPHEIIRLLSIEDVNEIHEKVMRLVDERGMKLEMALGFTLMNFGDKYVKVRCIKNEWTGTKADLTGNPQDIPKCPNGHVLFEISNQPRLALVEGE